MEFKNLDENLILISTIAGSHSYGLNTPSSDMNIRGIFFLQDYGLDPAEDEARDNTSDTTFYNLKKYMTLARDCNPNVLEILFCEDRHVLKIDERGKLLRANRDLFLSANARNRYAGYCFAQIKRMKSHHKWLNNVQPEEPPLLKDYCNFINRSGQKLLLSQLKIENSYAVKYNSHIYFLYYNSIRDDVTPGLFTSVPGQIREHDNNLVKDFEGTLIVDRQNFDKALDDWKNYWTWKKNRNEVRAALETQYKFDTKNASHAVRLMRTGLEILKEGKLRVFRPDWKELLDIRNGKWTYDQVLAHVKELDEEAEEIYKNRTYVVPYAPDKQKIDDLHEQLILL